MPNSFPRPYFKGLADRKIIEYELATLYLLRSAGSTDQVFLLNKHRKVDLGAFDPQRGAAPPRKGREGRLSQGEEGGEAETVLLRRAASLAHVEAGSSSSAGPGASSNAAQVGSSHCDRH
jgi:hypothetical protein